jgi:hypothetical protein
LLRKSRRRTSRRPSPLPTFSLPMLLSYPPPNRSGSGCVERQSNDRLMHPRGSARSAFLAGQGIAEAEVCTLLISHRLRNLVVLAVQSSDNAMSFLISRRPLHPPSSPASPKTTARGGSVRRTPGSLWRLIEAMQRHPADSNRNGRPTSSECAITTVQVQSEAFRVAN